VTALKPLSLPIAHVPEYLQEDHYFVQLKPLDSGALLTFYLCIDIGKHGSPLDEGDRVHIEIRRQNLVQWAVRVLRRHPDGLYAHVIEEDTSIQSAPLPLSAVVTKGIVIGKLVYFR